MNHHLRKTQLNRCCAVVREMESIRTGEWRIEEALNSVICTRGCVCVQILWAKHQSRKSIRLKDPAGLSSLHRRGGVTLATTSKVSSLPSPLLPQLDLSSSRAKEAPTSLESKTQTGGASKSAGGRRASRKVCDQVETRGTNRT